MGIKLPLHGTLQSEGLVLGLMSLLLMSWKFKRFYLWTCVLQQSLMGQWSMKISKRDSHSIHMSTMPCWPFFIVFVITQQCWILVDPWCLEVQQNSKHLHESVLHQQLSRWGYGFSEATLAIWIRICIRYREKVMKRHFNKMGTLSYIFLFVLLSLLTSHVCRKW